MMRGEMALRGLRRFQFTLRALFVSLTLLGVAFGYHCERVRGQRNAVRALRAAGGWVYYDFERYDMHGVRARGESPINAWLLRTFGVDHFHNVTVVNLEFDNYSGRHRENRTVDGAVIEQLQHLRRVRKLWLQGAQATDDGMRSIGTLKDLEFLSIVPAPLVTDDGVAHLRNLKKLKHVWIYKDPYAQVPRLTNASLKVVAALPAIEHISLDGGDFTDEGMRAFQGVGGLRSLSLRWASSTGDVGLGYLRSAVRLEHLLLSGTDVSDEGLGHLSAMRELTLLSLGRDCRRVTSAGIDHLAGLSKLEHLHLDNTTVSAEAFKCLRRLPRLDTLIISPCLASIGRVRKFLPTCDVL
jgi:hypothetical protein